MRMTKMLLLLAAGLAAGVTAAPAQDKFPSKPIKVEVPFGAGSATDIVIRIVGDETQAEGRAWLGMVAPEGTTG